MDHPYDYSIYHDFIKKFAAQGFLNIDRQDPMIADMEALLAQNRQFFHFTDLTTMQALFVSQGSIDYLGVEPDLVDGGTFLRALHPGDLQRHGVGVAQLVKIRNGLFDKKEGFSVLSTAFRLHNGSEDFKTMHFSGYVFFSRVPYDTVYLLMVITDVSGWKTHKHGFHHYFGNKMDHFRFPDKALLKIGNVFSEREFEILKLIAEGYDSRQIAQKLYVSLNTVNTHRRNILKKTNKSTTHDIVIDLQENGIL